MNRSSHNWKEARRLQAWRLKQKGWSQRQIAEALGVSEAAVSQWMTRARNSGPDALRHPPPPGARRRLTDEQLARLPRLLHQGPETYGFRGAVWIRSRIAVVIRVEFDISYHPSHVSRVCKAIRWTPQSPPGVRVSAMKRRLRAGASRPGPPLKKGGGAGADDPLYRRVRFLSPPQCRSHLCASRPDPHPTRVVDARPPLGHRCPLA
jgi:transposase